MSNTSSNHDTHKYCDRAGGGASNKEMYTSCEQNKYNTNTSSTIVDVATGGIDKMSISNAELSTCANCGKEGNDSDMNTCNRCNSVKYCNAACKKKHRSKHKKKCERRVAELYDEVLFKQPPPKEDCPICMIRLPEMEDGTKFNTCCGKIICSGCIYAVALRDGGVGLCPFCRAPTHTTDKGLRKELENRMKANDKEAIYNLGYGYAQGTYGCPQNHAKAVELYLRAGELGSTEAYCNVGNCYDNGRGVERDPKKALHYWEISAIRGRLGNMDRALKHFMISASDGLSGSLEAIKQLFIDGHATKEDYTKALQLYQAYLDEIKSDQRDDAAAHDSDQYKYY